LRRVRQTIVGHVADDAARTYAFGNIGELSATHPTGIVFRVEEAPPT
jgi:hypothetical protein